MRVYLLIFLSIFIYGKAFSQTGKSKFYPEGYGMLYKRKNINFVVINTENKTKPFFTELTRRFGSPIIADGYTIYKCTNLKWSNDKIVIRISKTIQIDLDKSKSNSLFIYVETKNHVDLLSPEERSSEKVKSYLYNLYLKEVVSVPLDSFDEQ